MQFTQRLLIFGFCVLICIVVLGDGLGARPLDGDNQEVLMNRTRVAIWIFAATSVLSLVAALIPILKGGSLNFAFLGIALLWFVIAMAVAKQSRKAKNTPPAA